MKSQLLLGIDIGGTKSSVVLGTLDGDILDKLSGPTEISLGPNATIQRLISDARSLLSRHSIATEDVLGVGICSGGPLDPEEGIIYSPANLPGWDSVPIKKAVEDELRLPAALENDADCCALAEMFFGAGKGRKNIVSFTWGTGIGAGIIINGRLYSGTTGLAGEIGHITYTPNGRRCGCGNSGCIEAYASGSSIARIARERVSQGEPSSLANLPSIDTPDVCKAARKGDQLAQEILSNAAKAMGHAVSLAAHTMNPELITLGTLAVKAGDLVMPDLMSVVETEVWERARQSLTICPTQLGDHVQDLAAISAFMGRLRT